MAANELATHVSLQPPAVPQECERLVQLMGGFVVEGGASAGEQVWNRVQGFKGKRGPIGGRTGISWVLGYLERA